MGVGGPAQARPRDGGGSRYVGHPQTLLCACLVKKGAMARAGALIAIGTGSLWPPPRVKAEIKGQEEMDAKCKHCGHHTHDEPHMFWNCPVINGKRKHSIRRTNGKYFDHNTGEIGQGTPCYFLRGLNSEFILMRFVLKLFICSK